MSNQKDTRLADKLISVKKNKRVNEAFRATYGEGYEDKFNQELAFLRMAWQPMQFGSSFSRSAFEKNIKADGLEDCFARLGSIKDATLDPLLKHFQIYIQAGSTLTFNTGWKYYVYLTMKRHEVLGVEAFTVREKDSFKYKMSKENDYDYQPSLENDRGELLYTVVKVRYIYEGATMIDIKPASFYNKRKKLSRSQKVHTEWSDEMALKTHCSHYLGTFGGIADELIKLKGNSFYSFDEDSTEQEDGTEIPITQKISSISANSSNANPHTSPTKKLMEATDSEVTKIVGKPDIETILDTIENCTAVSELNLISNTTIKQYKDEWTQEEKDAIKKAFNSVKKELEAVPAPIVEPKADLIPDNELNEDDIVF